MMADSPFCWPQSAQPAAVTRRVLMLSYFFPPSESVGAHRPAELYGRLPEFGWEPVAIVPEREGSPPGVIQTPDGSWMRRIEEAPAGSPLLQMRKGAGRLGSLVRVGKRLLRLFPPWHDEYAGWSYRVVGCAIEEGRRRKVDLVWATCNPFSLAPAALRVARALGVPCVIDLRDALPEYLHFPSGANHWFYRAMRGVDAVTAVAPCCATPELLVVRAGRPVSLILSGAWQAERIPAQPCPHFRLIHAGSLYGGRRNPEALLRALAMLAAEIPTFSADARVRFVGRDAPLMEGIPGYAEAAEMVEIFGQIPYRRVVEMTAESSVLLIINGDGYEVDDPLPGKFYDYLPFDAPILAFGGAGGILADALDWSGCGQWTGSVDAIVDFLHDCYTAWKTAGRVRAPRAPAALAYFSARRTAAETAEVLNATVEKREPACHPGPPWA